LAELIATSGLLTVIAMLEKSSPEKIPSCVALFILAATFFYIINMLCKSCCYICQNFH